MPTSLPISIKITEPWQKPFHLEARDISAYTYKISSHSDKRFMRRRVHKVWENWKWPAIFMKINEPWQTTFDSEDREASAHIHNHESFGSVVHEITHSQDLEGGGPRVVVSTAAFHARVRGSVPGLGGLKETKMFLPHPRVKVSIVGSLRDREVACSASDRQGSNFESCVWRTVSSQSSHHPQEVLLAQFSLYVHKGGLKPDSFHFIFLQDLEKCKMADIFMKITEPWSKPFHFVARQLSAFIPNSKWFGLAFFGITRSQLF